MLVQQLESPMPRIKPAPITHDPTLKGNNLRTQADALSKFASLMSPTTRENLERRATDLRRAAEAADNSGETAESESQGSASQP